MATKAIEGLLEKPNTDAAEIDLIICCTVTPDLVFPATANIVANNIGAVNSFGYDLQATCSGFLFGLNTEAKFIESGTYKKVVIIEAYKMSSIMDYTDRTTCIIFGDGASAVLLEPTEDNLGIKDAILRVDGSGEKHLHQKAGGSRKPATIETLQNREHYLYQEDSSVFKFAVINMADVSDELMRKNNLMGDDIKFLVPHQANKRIIDATAQQMGVGEEKVMLNIHKYGNTTNGTIPLCLHDYESQLKKGDNLILATFGGGFT